MAENSLRSSAVSMLSGEVPMMLTPFALSAVAEVQGSLAAELHDDAVGLLRVVDVEHLFEGERLEVETVAGVVVGGDGLRVAVDHDRLDAELLQSVGSMTAGVVEFDALADSVGPGAKDHHLLARARLRLALALVAGVEVGREALKLGSAGIDAIEAGGDAEFLAARADLERIGIPNAGEPHVGETVALGPLEVGLSCGLEGEFTEFFLV